jgi:redox-sensitive bicupin YhaK (pirin superfamily)
MPFPKESREGNFQLLASGNAADEVLTINADARVLGATIKAGESLSYDPDPARHVYLVPSGKVRVNGQEAQSRDGIAITGEDSLTIEAEEDSEVVLVDAR